VGEIPWKFESSRPHHISIYDQSRLYLSVHKGGEPNVEETLYQRALEYHRQLILAGKLKIVATKPLSTQEDLALSLFSRRCCHERQLLKKIPKMLPIYTGRGPTLLLSLRMERPF
jgi:hypothetical protein